MEQGGDSVQALMALGTSEADVEVADSQVVIGDESQGVEGETPLDVAAPVANSQIGALIDSQIGVVDGDAAQEAGDDAAGGPDRPEAEQGLLADGNDGETPTVVESKLRNLEPPPEAGNTATAQEGSNEQSPETQVGEAGPGPAPEASSPATLDILGLGNDKNDDVKDSTSAPKEGQDEAGKPSTIAAGEAPLSARANVDGDREFPVNVVSRGGGAAAEALEDGSAGDAEIGEGGSAGDPQAGDAEIDGATAENQAAIDAPVGPALGDEASPADEARAEAAPLMQLDLKEMDLGDIEMGDPSEWHNLMVSPRMRDTKIDEKQLVETEDGLDFLNISIEDDSKFEARQAEALDSIMFELSQMARERQPNDQYLFELEEDAMDEEIVIGTLPVDEAMRVEEQLEEQRVRELIAKRRAQRHLIKTLKERADGAVKALKSSLTGRIGELNTADANIRRKHYLKIKGHSTSYASVRSMLKKRVVQHRRAVERYFGGLGPSQSLSFNTEGSVFKKAWSKVPTTIRISFDRLRAVKNKLPGGRYFVMATLFDRIAGHPLKGLKHSLGEGSKQRTLLHFGATQPAMHNGTFFKVEMQWEGDDAHVFLACPPDADLQPAMCVMFELMLSKTSRMKTDMCVGWGVFPLCNEHVRIVSGRFKVPFLRGPVDMQLTKYSDIELAIAENLDRWLCNGYFEIRSKSRTYKGNNEKEEINSRADRLLQIADRSDPQGENSDGDDSDFSQELADRGENRDAAERNSAGYLLDATDDGMDSDTDSEMGSRVDAKSQLLPLPGARRGGASYLGDPRSVVESRVVSTISRAGRASRGRFSAMNVAKRRNKRRGQSTRTGMSLLAPSASRTASRTPTRTATRLGTQRKPTGLAKSITRFVTGKGRSTTRTFGGTRYQSAAAGSDLSESKAGKAGASLLGEAENTSVSRYASGAPRSVNDISHLRFAGSELKDGKGGRSVSFAAGGGRADKGGAPREFSSALGDDTNVSQLVSDNVSKDDVKISLFGAEGGLLGAKTDSKAQEAKEEDREFDSETSDEEEENRKFDREWQKQQLSKYNDLSQYQYSIVSGNAYQPSRNELLKRVRFLLGWVYGDLSSHRIKTLEFWTMILFFLMGFYWRMFIHFTGQYYFLSSMNLHPYSYECRPYNCFLQYNVDSTSLPIEMAMTIMGQLWNMLGFAGACSLIIILNMFCGFTLGDFMSQFMLCYGLLAILDPFFVIIGDAVVYYKRGDLFKLFYWFQYVEPDIGGGAGVVLTLLLVTVTAIAMAALFSFYLMRLHMGGRTFDIYVRTQQDESAFFLPHDMEVSAATLRHELRKARGFRSFEGNRRRVFVSSYIERDHLNLDFKKKTTHIALFTWNPLNPNRVGDLYRQFLWRPDGSILEVFKSDGDQQFETLLRHAKAMHQEASLERKEQEQETRTRRPTRQARGTRMARSARAGNRMEDSKRGDSAADSKAAALRIDPIDVKELGSAMNISAPSVNGQAESQGDLAELEAAGLL